MVTVPHIMVALERMLDYRGVGLERFRCRIFRNDFIHSLQNNLSIDALT